MTVRTQLLSPDQYAARLQEERAQAHAQAQARDKAAAAQRERQIAADKEYQQRTKDQVAEARRVEVQRSARKAAFQANLKSGDRFQWTVIGAFDSPFKGLVVRVEGALAFVQFDTLTMSGQNTRYLPKAELDPID